MSVKIGQTTQYDVYLEDKSMVGRFREFTEPELEWDEVEHAALGMSVGLSLPGRTLKGMKGKFTIEYLDSELYPRFYRPNVFVPLILVPYVDVFDSQGVDNDASYRVPTNITMAIRKIGGGAMKTGDKFQGDAEYSATRYVRGLPGAVPWREIDVMNQVNRINGENVWSDY